MLIQCLQISFPESTDQDGEGSALGGAKEKHLTCLATEMSGIQMLGLCLMTSDKVPFLFRFVY